MKKCEFVKTLYELFYSVLDKKKDGHFSDLVNLTGYVIRKVLIVPYFTVDISI